MYRSVVTRLRGGGHDPNRDGGIAMIMVMASITVLGMLLAAAFTMAIQAQPGARRSQDWNAALAAAQAGVDDYIARLNQSDSYWTSIDCTNPALKGPKAGTNTCGWSASTGAGFQNVQPGNPDAGGFHYDVDSSGIFSQGILRVNVTGKVRSSARSIQVLVSRGGSTDFLYFTDFEDADPGNTEAYPTGPSTDACGKTGPTNADYWWENSSRGCSEIQFVTGDTLDGAVHFNDTPYINGSTVFLKQYETADPACKTPSVANCRRGSGTPNFNGGLPSYAPPLYLPDNSSQFVNYPGCKYTGDTRIRFNSDGTMTVWSTRSAGTVVGTGCGNPAGPWPQTVAVPNDQVIYVKNASTQAKCTTGQIGDGLPIANDVNMDNPTFYCGNGNAYVEGTLKGRVTLAAQNNVVVTDDVLLAGTPAGSATSGPDMLGLVSANSVVVYHPVNSSGTNLKAPEERWIYASIQTLQHSFWVQSYADGAKMGTLHVRGSIAQRWRGIVGTGGSTGTGYLKDYGYDARLKFTSPPYFPQWTNAVWGAKTTAELSPQY
jgi:hypothetical protein